MTDSAAVEQCLKEIVTGKCLFVSLCKSAESRKLARAVLATGRLSLEQINSTARENGNTMLTLCTRVGSVATVVALIAAGADVNKADADGFRRGDAPLLVAAGAGREDLVRLLLAAKADVDGEDRRGTTALMAAVAVHHVGIVWLLLDAGANVGLNRGYCFRGRLHRSSPLHLVGLQHAASEQVVRLLLDSGADANLCDSMGISPMFRAVVAGSEIGLRCFLLAGAHTDPTLYYAAFYNKATSMALLLASGADHSIAGEDGVLPLTEAVIAGSDACALLLLAAGAPLTGAVLDAVQPPSQRGKWIDLAANERALADGKRTIVLAGLHAIRWRALEILAALQELALPAPLLVEIVEHACAPFASNLPYHCLWNLVVCVKHLKR